ncbi:MAG: LysR family transcriptional regulator [Hyphomicrobiaceae bacterium]|nr:LysR family transcriptional regulator [Hyphomicrobiaceae bacterium]
MEAFIRVVGAGSFSAAARMMKLTPSAVSKLMSRIESQLGVRLIDRSTRQFRLTPEGELYYNRCVKIVAEIEETEYAVTQHLMQPRGRLRVNSTIGIGIHRILPLMPEFLSAFPSIELDLSLSDRVVDLVEEQAEVAIRVGPLQDSSLMARKLCESRRVVVASPVYLERHGTPRHPADLPAHNCLAYNLRPTLNEWPFKIDGGVRPIAVRGNFHGDNGETLRHMALGGAGIARLGWFQVGENVRQGRLVPLLEEFHAGELQGVYAVFFGMRHTSVRVTCFVDFLVEKLGCARPWLASEYAAAAA